VHQVALFSRKSTLDFALHEWNLGDHRLSPAQHGSGQTIQVEAAPLDQFDGEVTGAVAAKIDTQGAEPFVIAGGHSVLSRAKLVVIEFAPGYMHELNGDPGVVLEFLEGFEQIAVGSISGDDLPIFRPATEALVQLKTLLSEWRSGDSRYYDVFASRGYIVRQPATP
jgi:hypothetical protein